MEIMQNIEPEVEAKVFFFKSSWRGKVGLHVFEQEGVVDLVTDRKEAKSIRQNNLFKNGVVVELTEEQIAQAKAEEAERLNATIVVEMNQEEFEDRVAKEVEKRLAKMAKKEAKSEKKKSAEKAEPDEDEEAQKLAEDISVAKAYLDEHDIPYHPATGIVKLEEKVAEHQAANPE